jgi:hypothetical protein
VTSSPAVTVDPTSPAGHAAPLGARITATFASPRKLIELIRDRPVWVDVLIVSTGVAIMGAAMLPPETFLDASREAVSRRGTPVDITSPPEEIVRWGRYLAMLSAVVGHPLIAFALAGLLTLTFSLVPGGRNTFVEHLSLSSHALLIPALGTVVGFALGYLAGPEHMHPSLALLVPFLPTGTPVLEYLALISPFTLWMLVVVAIGVGRLDPRRSSASSTAILVGAYLVLALVLAS